MVCFKIQFFHPNMNYTIIIIITTTIIDNKYLKWVMGVSIDYLDIIK